jgi:glycosyltransferase involved in cell wall biosynthesis
MARVLVISSDQVGRAMAGPGIRALELARALAGEHQVTLAVPGPSDLQSDELLLASYAPEQSDAFTALLAATDIIVGQGFVFAYRPELLAADCPLAIDLYDPLILESLDLYATADLAGAEAQHDRYQSLTDRLLARGDFFFCANERQRDYWLGALTAAGRITPALARTADRDLYSLIDLVPSGIAATAPVAAAPVLRGVHPAIAADDLLLLWAGGLWDWFDPQVIIQAMAQLQTELPQLRLCFFAGPRPNPDGDPFRTAVYDAARNLAGELGLLDRSVVFLDTWVPYHERGAYLAEADIGVSAHRAGIETRLAFRTRLLDYLWARLPLVASAGDSLSATIAAAGGGLLVAPGDVAGWVAALRRLAGDAALRAEFRTAIDQLAEAYTWDRVAQPLRTFCRAPRRTALTARPAAPDPCAELHTEIARKNRHIVQLEQLLHQIEQGRIMRLLHWLKLKR